MPKTLAEIELLCDPLLSEAELVWWQRVWTDAGLAEPESETPAPALEMPRSPVEATFVYAGRLRVGALPDGDDGVGEEML